MTVAALGMFFSAGVCAVSFYRDCTLLRTLARDVTSTCQTPYETVIDLMNWVYRDLGTRRNDGKFFFSALGATPVQVMRDGGDCADKSRLLCALLREVGMSATPALCFDRNGALLTAGACRSMTALPVHTIVEVRVTDGSYMVVDPAYNLYFPRIDGAGYHDLLDLRRDPAIVERRVDELFRNLPTKREEDKYYLRAFTGYHAVSTFNWEKGPVHRSVRNMLHSWIGEQVYRIQRPLFLERPKFMVAMGFLLLGGVLLFTPIILTSVVRRRRDRQLESSSPVSSFPDGVMQ